MFKVALQLAICGNPATASVGCAVAVTAGFSAGSTLAEGGSIGDAIKSAAISFAQAAAFTVVGAGFDGAPFLVKEAVHGVVGGAFSVATGVKFHQGFAANFLGAAGGRLGTTLFGSPREHLANGARNPNYDGSSGAVVGRTMFAAVAGGTGSAITGGKFANGAAAAAIGHLFNSENDSLRRALRDLQRDPTPFEFDGFDQEIEVISPDMYGPGGQAFGGGGRGGMYPGGFRGYLGRHGSGRLVGHHITPREILKAIPKNIANHPSVRDTRGNPNIWRIPEHIHLKIHEGSGGGKYNQFFFNRIDQVKAQTGRLTVRDMNRISDGAVKHFGLEQFQSK